MYRRIAAALAGRIDDGTLPPGTRLNIGALSDEFDVSRDTVQRAIQLLAEDGRVERFPGLGWYVTGGSLPGRYPRGADPPGGTRTPGR